MAVIELSDEQAAALAARAAARGLSLEAWLKELAADDAPVRPRQRSRYMLAELMSQCDLSVPLSEEDHTWLDAPAVGSEL